MATLELDRLERLAAVLCGAPVVVRFEDLRFLELVGAVTSEADGKRAILLDERLVSDPEEFSFTFLHECGHLQSDCKGSHNMREVLADGYATVCAIRIGATAPWRMAHSDTTDEERGRILQLAEMYAASTRAESHVRSSGVPYTPALLEAEFRSGALDRALQTKPGSLESMIANSLGLASGERGRVEKATAGGAVWAAR